MALYVHTTGRWMVAILYNSLSVSYKRANSGVYALQKLQIYDENVALSLFSVHSNRIPIKLVASAFIQSQHSTVYFKLTKHLQRTCELIFVMSGKESL
jgi:uncharacterized protein (DUF486 family)